MFAALDLATGQMFYRFRDRKRWQEFLTFLKQIRVRYPAGKLYIVCDNYGPHKKAEAWHVDARVVVRHNARRYWCWSAARELERAAEKRARRRSDAR